MVHAKESINTTEVENNSIKFNKEVSIRTMKFNHRPISESIQLANFWQYLLVIIYKQSQKSESDAENQEQQQQQVWLQEQQQTVAPCTKYA